MAYQFANARFEGSNIVAGIMSPSPVQEYIEAMDDLPDADRSLIAKLDLIQKSFV